MREKTGARATLTPWGYWSVEGGNPIIRSSVKLYRNGLRMTQGVDYNLDAGNPHYFRSIGQEWDSDAVVIMDYLY